MHRPIVAIDAMGGDRAPQAIVDGALRCVGEADIDVLLVGDAAAVMDAVAVTVFRCRSPFGLSSRRPPVCMALRCAPRAMNATSVPAAARRAPKYPPTPPAPMIAIRTRRL